ncbi:MAG: hypothetical protein Q9224_006322, partial [Gallowayella concinna]
MGNNISKTFAAGQNHYRADVASEQGHTQEAHEGEAVEPMHHDRPFEAISTQMTLTGPPSQTGSPTTMSQKKRARSPDEEGHGPPSKLSATGKTFTGSKTSSE